MPTPRLAGPCGPHEWPPPTQSYRLSAPNVEITPKVARDLVASLLTATGHPALVDTARVLVSEIVTNVVLHTAQSLLTLEATVWAGRVAVQVTDTDERQPFMLGKRPDDQAYEHGRGLRLVDALATRWGVDIHGSPPWAKSVWFELED